MFIQLEKTSNFRTRTPCLYTFARLHRCVRLAQVLYAGRRQLHTASLILDNFQDFFFSVFSDLRKSLLDAHMGPLLAA